MHGRQGLMLRKGRGRFHPGSQRDHGASGILIWTSILQNCRRMYFCCFKPVPGSLLQQPCVHMCLVTQSCGTLCDSINCSPPGSFSLGFPRQEYGRGLPFPPPGGLSDPGIESASFMFPALAGGFFTC